MQQLIQKKDTARIDYIDIVDIDSLERIKKIAGNCLIVLAVWIGKTRLIDNIRVEVKRS
jgi:pantoate--beta-alanine ligase